MPHYFVYLESTREWQAPAYNTAIERVSLGAVKYTSPDSVDYIPTDIYGVKLVLADSKRGATSLLRRQGASKREWWQDPKNRAYTRDRAPLPRNSGI